MPRSAPPSFAVLFALAVARAPAAQSQGEGADQAPDEPLRTLELTLEDAVRMALRNNVSLRIEAEATERTEFEALGSWGAFDPNVSFTGNVDSSDIQGTSSLSGGDVVQNDTLGLSSTVSIPHTLGGRLDLTFSHSNDETTNRFAAFDVSTTDVFTIALTQPLLRGAWRRFATTAQEESELAFETQRERERQVRKAVLRDVSLAYWDLVSAIEELRVRELAVELGRRQLEQDRKRRDVGVGTDVDVLQSETNVAQQQERRLQAESALRAAEDALRRLIIPPSEGGDLEGYLDRWDWPIRPLTALPETNTDDIPRWREAVLRALELRPELAQRRLEIDSAELGIVQARSNWLPQLDLNLSTSGIGFDADPAEAFRTAVGFDFPSQTASLTFSMPLWNRSARFALRAARAAARAARWNYEATELAVLAEVRAAVRDLRYSVQSVQAATQSRTFAERQLEAEKTRQRVGSSTTFQVLQFQEDLAQALSAEVAARVAYAKARTSLLYATGELAPPAAGEPSAVDPSASE